MPGGKIQLTAYGEQNKIFTDNPDISYFIVLYKSAGVKLALLVSSMVSLCQSFSAFCAPLFASRRDR